MLNEGAWKSVQQIMKVGSFMKFIPYKWDNKTRRFLKAGIWHLIVFNFHFATTIGMLIFSGIRLALANKKRGDEAVPKRIITMTTLWLLVYMLEFICFVQFHLKMDQIMYYANSLFAYIDKDHDPKNKVIKDRDPENIEETGTEMAARKDSIVPAPPRLHIEIYPKETPRNKQKKLQLASADDKKPRDWVSIFVQLGTFMLIANPPSHSVMLSDNPCAPHFLSSLFLYCPRTDYKSQPILQKIPFVLIENFTITTLFYELTFNWAMIFLGLAWIKTELEKSRIKREDPEDEKIIAAMEKVPTNYRYIQMIQILMNDSFRFYLTWFPSILLGVVAFLLFAVIRFWYLDFRSYMMFPLCGCRCIFETFTPLTLAGYVNNECIRVKKQWKTESSNIQFSNQDDNRWIRRFQRSCAFVKATAGSLYSFENSIVLVTICNCTLLTCNLLIMFKGVE